MLDPWEAFEPALQVGFFFVVGLSGTGYAERELLFRLQFLLGTRFLDWLTGWKRLEVRGSICIMAHPDLPVTQVVDGPRSITVLGYLLDPADPEAADLQIASRLLQRLGETPDAAAAVEWTYDLGGRWVLVVDDGARVQLFHDAMGLRTVFYTDRSLLPETWCASQPGLIAEALGLARDPVADAEVVNSSAYRESQEYRWPGDRCVYREIRHLLPNHGLDVLSGARRRYWPDRPLGRIPLGQAVETASGMLKGLIRAAANRFPLSLATTAGWDTRLILAASREFSHRMHFFTRRKNNPADISTVPRLLSRLGLPHQMIEIPDRMDPEFEDIYRRSVTEAHEYWGRMAQGMYKVYPRDRVCVTGNAAEITRNRFRFRDGETASARAFARLNTNEVRFQDRLQANPYVVKAWEEWLGAVGNLHDVEILDLFLWEHFSGNFAAMGETEYGIVTEFFTPFDCRRLLVTMLAVDKQYREHDRPQLYVEMMKKMWPEVLSEPVNERYEGFFTPLLRAARRMGVSGLIPASLKKEVRRWLGASRSA